MRCVATVTGVPFPRDRRVRWPEEGRRLAPPAAERSRSPAGPLPGPERWPDFHGGWCTSFHSAWRHPSNIVQHSCTEREAKHSLRRTFMAAPVSALPSRHVVPYPPPPCVRVPTHVRSHRRGRLVKLVYFRVTDYLSNGMPGAALTEEACGRPAGTISGRVGRRPPLGRSRHPEREAREGSGRDRARA